MSALGKFLGATLRIVTIPFTVAADAMTMGGVLVDRERSFTAETVKKIGRDIERGINEIEK